MSVRETTAASHTHRVLRLPYSLKRTQQSKSRAYCEGRGVDSARPSQCYAWLKIAQNNSSDTLKLTIQNALEIVEAEVTPEERTQGEKLIQEYQTKGKKENPAKDVLNLF